MDSGTDSPATGRHLLGPHVVGRRVVVRRLLRGQVGPSGGPAMTDVLGVCTAWSHGVCVVRPESGEPVEILVADIVSGKPVPPRPSVRHRVSPDEAQRHALSLWPDLATAPLGGWVLRTSETSRARRANSVLAMGDPGVADPLGDVTGFYAERGRRPIAALVPGSWQWRLFHEAGWVPESNDGETLFQLASVARARRALGPVPPAPEPTYDEDGDLVTVRLGAVASGVAAVDGDWVGFRTIHVAPEERRSGLGLAVMAELLDWGAQRGATTAYLQVLDDNAPALALYERLGFRTHHGYCYLAAPA